MSVDRWNSVLVLGGIRSGKSAFAEALVADAPSVRYIATAVGGEDDPEWMNRIEAHQRRRPQTWSTEETGPDPARLAAVLADAKPDDTLLVDDLGGWVASLLDPAHQPNDDVASVDALADAVRGCAARLVVVSPEVGLSLVPTTPLGRAFADALGTANQALAAACDRVALVVAGQPTWLKPDAAVTVATPPDAPVSPAAAPAPAPAAAPDIAVESQVVTPPPLPAAEPSVPVVAADGADAADALSRPTMVLPLVGSGAAIEPGMDLPLPDPDAGPDARDRLTTLDLAGAGVGSLGEVVEFAASVQGTVAPRPWTAPRVLLLAGAHAGGAAAGHDGDAERRVAQVAAGEGALIRLAADAGADVVVVRVPESGPMEDGPVLDAGAVEAALRQGWELADAAATAGRDVLVLGSSGVGTDAAATAVMAATTGAEPAAVLPRVLTAGGRFDDAAWMLRCAAVRDALHRIRQESRGAADILAQLGGADLAVATGALLGAAARRLPVLLDGPVGVAAALVARDFAGQARHWCLIAEAGTTTLVRQSADVLGLTPVVQLGLDLGEGSNALAALPLLRTAVGLASALPVHPDLLENPGDDGLTDEDDFREPAPSGPGPATTGAAGDPAGGGGATAVDPAGS
jgi:adenosyl cobinamide kinase/adenosyl cobinamide phosphate guanylyltransferase/NaMN:DMB phosphoribosyltransferase